jgi:hypothetical protein
VPNRKDVTDIKTVTGEKEAFVLVPGSSMKELRK